VNARVEAEDKQAADRVLAASQRTWSQAIQALAAYMKRTNSFPEVLSQPALDKERERQRGWELLMSMSGIATSPDLATDEGTAQVFYDAMMARHG